MLRDVSQHCRLLSRLFFARRPAVTASTSPQRRALESACALTPEAIARVIISESEAADAQIEEQFDNQGSSKTKPQTRQASIQAGRKYQVALSINGARAMHSARSATPR